MGAGWTSLPKPFNPRECWPDQCRSSATRERRTVARCAQQRRGVGGLGDFVLDLATRTLTVPASPSRLTRGEFAVLKAFARHPACRYRARSDGKWRGASTKHLTVPRRADLALRKLIEPDPAKPRFIQTVWGSATCSFRTAAPERGGGKFAR